LRCSIVILTWRPYWYELDQTVIVGDIDYFYLDKDEKKFANDYSTSSVDKEVRGEIIKITHPELGELLGILTFGLSYKFFFTDGKFIRVDAEEKVGHIEYPNDDIKVNDWVFEVELHVLEVTGLSSLERRKRTMETED
jgi:hypothetical protein